MNLTKRLLAGVLLLCALGLLPAQTQASQRYWARGKGTDVYFQPKGDMSVFLSAETPFLVTGSQGGWLAVEWISPAGLRTPGWVKREAVTERSPDGKGMLAVVENPKAGDRLHLRAKPRRDSISLGRYYSGVPVWVLSVKGGWAKVSVDHVKGYMQADFLTFGEEALDRYELPLYQIDPTKPRPKLRLTAHPNSSNIGMYDSITQVWALGTAGDRMHVAMSAFPYSGYLEAGVLKLIHEGSRRSK